MNGIIRLGWRPLVSFGIVYFLAVFLWMKIPRESPLFTLPVNLMLLSGFPLLFAWYDRSESKKKIAGWSCATLWILGIVLSFMIPAKSPFISVPDSLLLLGFVPLLYSWRFSWTWMIFGAFNTAIGLLLNTVNYLPNDPFPPELIVGKQHLADYHEPIAWMFIGSVTFIYGVGRFIRNVFFKKKPPTQPA